MPDPDKELRKWNVILGIHGAIVLIVSCIILLVPLSGVATAWCYAIAVAACMVCIYAAGRKRTAGPKGGQAKEPHDIAEFLDYEDVSLNIPDD